MLPAFDRRSGRIGSSEKTVSEDGSVLVIVEFAVLFPGDTAAWTQKIEAISRVIFLVSVAIPRQGSHRYHQTTERRVTEDQTS